MRFDDAPDKHSCPTSPLAPMQPHGKTSHWYHTFNFMDIRRIIWVIWCHGLGFFLQCCAAAPYMWSEAATFCAVALFTISYIYILFVAYYNTNSVQSSNPPHMPTAHIPQHLVAIKRVRQCRPDIHSPTKMIDWNIQLSLRTNVTIDVVERARCLQVDQWNSKLLPFDLVYIPSLWLLQERSLIL